MTPAQEAKRRYREANRERINQREAQRRAKRRIWMDSLKLASGCVDCGYNAHPCALDFDHVRGEKQFNIGANLCMAMDRLKAEIDKCEVVCANCHRVRTHRRNEETQHGKA